MSREDDLIEFCRKNDMKLKIEKKKKLYYIKIELVVTKAVTSASTDRDQAIELISKSLSRLK